MAQELLEPMDGWICKGANVDSARYERLKFLDEHCRCRMKALDLLARRNHGTAELQRKLLQREFSKESVSSTLGWLQGKGYLDDIAFARSWVRTRLRKGGDSPRSLDAGLRKKGLSPSVVHEILQEVPEESFRESLQAAMDRLWRKSSMTREKCIQSLGRKGFPYSWIKDALEERNA